MSDLDDLKRQAPDLFGDPLAAFEAATPADDAPWWDLWSPIAAVILPLPAAPQVSQLAPDAAIKAVEEFRAAADRRLRIQRAARVTGAVHTWLLRPLGATLGALHGRGRGGSAATTIFWGTAGAAAPLVTIGAALAQGFARRS